MAEDKAPDQEKEPTEPVTDAKPRPTAKPRGRPKGSKSKAKIDKEAIRTAFQKGIQAANAMVLAELFPSDALTPDEIDMLAEVGVVEIAQNPKLAAWMSKVGGASKHGELIKAAMIIAYPRLVAHGLIRIHPQQSEPEQPAEGASVPMEPGGALRDNRGHGNGEIDAISLVSPSA